MLTNEVERGKVGVTVLKVSLLSHLVMQLAMMFVCLFVCLFVCYAILMTTISHCPYILRAKIEKNIISTICHKFFVISGCYGVQHHDAMISMSLSLVTVLGRQKSIQGYNIN